MILKAMKKINTVLIWVLAVEMTVGAVAFVAKGLGVI